MTQHHVDIDTGELVMLTPVAQSVRYVYSGGYLTMGTSSTVRLAQAKLPADGYRLALTIASKAVPVSGLVHCSNDEYAKELGLTPNRVSRLISQLARLRFIYRAGPKLIIVNPGWCFRGSPQQQHAAHDEWAKLHPIGTVPAETKA